MISCQKGKNKKNFGGWFVFVRALVCVYLWVCVFMCSMCVVFVSEREKGILSVRELAHSIVRHKETVCRNCQKERKIEKLLIICH